MNFDRKAPKPYRPGIVEPLVIGTLAFVFWPYTKALFDRVLGAEGN